MGLNQSIHKLNFEGMQNIVKKNTYSNLIITGVAWLSSVRVLKCMINLP